MTWPEERLEDTFLTETLSQIFLRILDEASQHNKVNEMHQNRKERGFCSNLNSYLNLIDICSKQCSIFHFVSFQTARNVKCQLRRKIVLTFNKNNSQNHVSKSHKAE